MADITPIYEIPFIEGTDIGDQIDDVSQAQAERLEELFALLMPVGTLTATARATAPGGWLLCDGAAVSRTTYTELFDAIGTAYGVGNGSTTFNLPDLRGRVPVGVDASAARLAANDALGQSGGAETHTLLEAQMPSHEHGPGNLATGTAGAHTHTGANGGGLLESAAVHGVGTFQGIGADGDTGFVSTNSAGSHNHAITSGTTSARGSGTAHNNMQPFQVVNYMIKI